MHDEMCEQDVQGALVTTALFKPKKWQFTVSFINRLIKCNNVLIAVLAEHKGGKTTCVSLLREGLAHDIHFALLNANVYLTSAHANKHLADCLDIPWSRALTLSMLVEYINEKKEHFVLAIDDAHFVPYTLLQDMLLEIQKHGDNNYFHVCLFSDFSIIPRLNSLSTRRFNNLIYSMELGALSESETKAYVLQTLKPAHPLVQTPSEEKFQAFFEQNAGSMAQINQNRDAFFHVSISKVRRIIWAVQGRFQTIMTSIGVVPKQCAAALISVRKKSSSLVQQIYGSAQAAVLSLKRRFYGIGSTLFIHTRIPSGDGLTGRVPARDREQSAIRMESKRVQAVYHKTLEGIIDSLDTGKNRIRSIWCRLQQAIDSIKELATIHTRIPSANGLSGQNWNLFCRDDPDAKPVKPKRNRNLAVLTLHARRAWNRALEFSQSVREFFTWDVKAIFFGESSSAVIQDSRPQVSRSLPYVFALAGTVFLSVGLWQNLTMPELEPTPIMKKTLHTVPFMAKAPAPVPVLKSKVPALTVAATRVPMQSSFLRIINEEDDSMEKLVVRDSVLVIPKPMPVVGNITTAVAQYNLLPGKRIALATAKDKGPHHFTVQLLASVADHDLRRFIIKQHLVGKVRTRTILKDGVKWYVLTMGDYGRKDLAQRSIRRLSPQLIKLHPWVRAVDEFSAVG